MNKFFTFLLLIFANATHSQKFLHPIITTIQNLDPGNVTEMCAKQLEEYQQNLKFDETSWALQMLDATSKLQSGILSFNLGELGNFDQCIKVRTNQTEFGEILGKYCLGFITINNEIFNNNNKSEQLKNFLETFKQVSKWERLQGPTWAICLPNGCSANDATVLVNKIFQDLFELEGISIGFVDLLCQTSNEVYPEISNGAIATIVILALLLLVVLLSTIYEAYYIIYRKGISHAIVVAFSAYSNGRKIFKLTPLGPDQLPSLDGLKFISMLWIVALHSYSVPEAGPLTNTGDVLMWANSLHSMIVSSTVSVDTFFVAGGCLMAYGYMKARKKEIPLNLPLYYIHRYIRLTPSIAVVVLVSSTLLKYMGSGPKWPLLVQYFQQNCVDYWWSTLIYTQNYVNVGKMCVGQTWYLDIDMQLYLISPILFTLLWKWWKIGFSIMVGLALASIGSAFHAAWSNNLPAIITNFYQNHSDYSNKYYLLTHTRASTWLIGALLGYVIFKIKRNELIVKINKILVIVLWVLSLAVLLTCVLGGHDTLRHENFDKWGNSLYIALMRPSWAIAISWIILACVLGYGGPINWMLSLPIYQVFNRFTYSIYLTHVTLLYMIQFGRKAPSYFSDFNMMLDFWGTWWFSSLLAVFIVFTVEFPMLAIEKILFGNCSSKPKKAASDVEQGVDNLAFKE